MLRRWIVPKGASMKRLRVVAISLVLCGLLFGCASGPDKSGPISAVENYYKALNANDFEAMLDACDNTTATTLRGSMDTLSGLLSTAGNGEVDVRSFVASLYPSLAATASDNDVTYKFTPRNYTVEFDGETRATVRYTVDIEVNNAGNIQTSSQKQEYNVVKERDAWKLDLSSEIVEALAAFDIIGSLFG